MALDQTRNGKSEYMLIINVNIKLKFTGLPKLPSNDKSNGSLINKMTNFYFVILYTG